MNCNNLNELKSITSFQSNFLGGYLQGDNAAYHLRYLFKVTGKFNFDVFCTAWQSVICENESLRTYFIERNGQFFQAIEQVWLCPVVLIPLLDSNDSEIEISLNEVKSEVFQINQLPLHKVTVLQIKSEEFFICINFHHIIVDAYSIKLFLKRLSYLYEFPETKISYPKVSKESEDSIIFDEEKNKVFWPNFLRGFQKINLGNRESGKIYNFSGARHYFSIENSVVDRIRNVFQSCNGSLFNIIVCVLGVCLKKVYENNNFIIGFAKNTRSEVQANSSGFYLNMLPIKIFIQEDAKFIDLLKAINDQRSELNVIGYTYPTHKIIRSLSKEHSDANDGIFNVTVVQTSFFKNHLTLFETKVTNIPIYVDSVQNDLSLIYDSEDGLQFAFDYRKELFSETGIVQLSNIFKEIMSQIQKNPNAYIKELFLMNDNELAKCNHQNSHNWPQIGSEYSLIKCFNKNFYTYADKVAISFQKQKVFYAEVDRISKQFSCHLYSSGASEGQLVVILLERSIEFIISVISVLRSGAAYVPLDPSTPTKRLNEIIRNTNAKLIITNTVLRKTLISTNLKLILYEEFTWKNTEIFEIPQCSKNRLVYVIYTSGSTGVPKGVMIGEEALWNYLNFANSVYPKSGGSLLHGSIAFDLSITSLLLPLIRGESVEIVPENSDPAYYITLIRNSQRQYSFIKLTPTQLRLLADEVTISELENKTKCLIIGGEQLQKWHFGNWLNSNSQLQIYNEYGPTEATVGCCVYSSTLNELKNLDIVPIGKPINNVKMYVVNSEGNEMPAGLIGELYLSGISLAEGYWKDKDLTRQYFINHTVANGEKIYKTGDLVISLENHNFQFLGRNDNVIKIRGYRVCLSEISMCLQKNKYIKNCVVVSKDDAIDKIRIIAYLIINDKYNSIFKSDLLNLIRKFLTKELPSYMLPHKYIIIEKFFTTSNGKLDFQKLPEPDFDIPDDKLDFIAPKKKLEKRLAKIWEKYLGIKKIGINDDFFELGGDSISAIQAVNAGRQLGLDFEYKDIFLHSQLSLLAEKIKDRKNKSSSEFKNKSSQIEKEIALLSPIQNWFIERKLENINYYCQTVVVQSKNILEKQYLIGALNEVVNRHEALRTRFRKDENSWVQSRDQANEIKYFDDSIWHHVENINSDDFSNKVDKLKNIFLQEMDINKPPLFKIAVFEDKKNRQKLLMVCHHLIIDVVSWWIFLEELEVLYENYANHKIIKSNNTTKLIDWFQYLKENSNAAITEFEKTSIFESMQSDKIWLANESSIHAKQKTDKNFFYSIKFDKKLTGLLKEFSTKKLFVNLQNLIIAALAKVIFQNLHENKKLLIMLETHGRYPVEGYSKLELGNVIGWFTNFCPLFFEFDMKGSLHSFLDQVNSQIKQMPNLALKYTIARYMDDLRKGKKQIFDNLICFNYLGDSDKSPLTNFSLDYMIQLEQDPVNKPYFLLDIVSYIYQNELVINFSGIDINNLSFIINNISREVKNYLSRILFLEKQYTSVKHLEKLFPVEYMLSHMQKGMLYDALKNPKSDRNFVQSVFCIEGELCPVQFKKAWVMLASETGALRNSFQWEKLSVPIQIENSSIDIIFNFYDFSVSFEENKNVESILLEIRNTLFHLDIAPLWRLDLIKVKENSFNFVWSFHHIILDGWCMPILLRNFCTIYENLIKRTKQKTNSTVSFQTYIDWLYKQDYQSSLSFWEKRLKSVKPCLLIESWGSYHQEFDSNFICEELFLDDSLVKECERVAKFSRITPSTLLQACWSFLLCSYTQDKQVTFGLVVSGRHIPLEMSDNIVGLMMNTIPVTITLLEGEVVGSALTRLQNEFLELNDHSYVSLSDIQQKADHKGVLFDSLVVIENYPGSALTYQINDLFTIKYEYGIEKSEYPITLLVTQYDNHWKINLFGNQTVITKKQLWLIKEHFYDCIKYVLENVSQSFTLSNLSKYMSQKVANNTYLEPLLNKSFTPLLSMYSLLTNKKNGIAINCGASSITFHDLYQKTLAVSSCLYSFSANSKSRIWILLSNPIDIIVSMFSIWKIGAHYIILNYQHPKEYVKKLFTSYKDDIVITDIENSINFDFKNFIIFNEALNYKVVVNNDLIKRKTNELATIIYTSGSTGDAKGVMITHENLWKSTMLRVAFYEDMDGVLCLLNPSFDAALGTIMWAIAAGKPMFLEENLQHTDFQLLFSKLKNEKITHIISTPSLYKHLLSCGLSKLIFVQNVILGGEVITNELLGLHSEQLPKVNLFSEYGVTEATVWSSVKKVYDGHKSEMLSNNIGTPLPGNTFYILSESYSLQPCGTIGELAIGGAQVAKGYIADPKLSSAKFINLKLPTEIVEQVYLTGDLARLNEDGEFELKGRKDWQVKSSGFRIDMGEIQKTLITHEDIKECFIYSHSNISGERPISAYIILNNSFNNTMSENLMRNKFYEFLKLKLPEYMLPKFYVFLENLPMNLNGKIDTNKLRIPLLNERVVYNNVTEVDSNVSKEVLKICCEILAIPNLQIGENFFTAGGSSLLAMQAVSRLNKKFNIKYKISDFFLSSTIADISNKVSLLQSESSEES